MANCENKATDIWAPANAVVDLAKRIIPIACELSIFTHNFASGLNDAWHLKKDKFR
jgi:hypothetical protein